MWHPCLKSKCSLCWYGPFSSESEKGGKGDVLTVGPKLFVKSNLKFLQHIEWKADLLKVVFFPLITNVESNTLPTPLSDKWIICTAQKGRPIKHRRCFRSHTQPKVVFCQVFCDNALLFCIYLTFLFSAEILCSHNLLVKIPMTNLSFRLLIYPLVNSYIHTYIHTHFIIIHTRGVFRSRQKFKFIQFNRHMKSKIY